MATAIKVQYSGIWTLQQVNDAIAAKTWTGPWGYLYAIGGNSNGQLGLGNTTYYSSPKQVGALTNWKSVAQLYAGSTLAIQSNGTLWSWGNNDLGQLGLGNATVYSSPKQVGSLTNWSQVSGGSKHSLAVKTDGTLWAWGRGSTYGALGLGNVTNYSSPKQVGLLTNWLSVSCGYNSTFAVKTDGTLWSWGDGTSGVLGLGNTTYYSSPKQIGALTSWQSVSSSRNNFTGAVKTDGTLWMWGLGSFGVLGQGNTTSYSSPKQVGGLSNWSSISVTHSRASAIAIKTNGTLWGWGLNTSGQLGLSNFTNYSSPMQVGALTNWLSVATGYRFTMSIKTNKTLWGWGENSTGQLGTGNTTTVSSPVQIGSLTSWLAVSGSIRATIAILQA